MKKSRCYLAAIALAAALGGPALLGIGVGSLANAASGHHVSASSVAGKSTRSVAFKRTPPCPGSATIDC